MQRKGGFNELAMKGSIKQHSPMRRGVALIPFSSRAEHNALTQDGLDRPRFTRHLPRAASASSTCSISTSGICATGTFSSAYTVFPGCPASSVQSASPANTSSVDFFRFPSTSFRTTAGATIYAETGDDL